MRFPRFARLVPLLVFLPFVRADVAWQRLDSHPAGLLPPPAAAVENTAAVVADLDRDGAVEIVIGGRNSAPAIQVWKRTGARWERHVVEPDDVRIEAGGCAYDIDGDGDLDLVFGGDYRSAEIWWWENPGSVAQRWPRHVIKRDGGRQHHDQMIGDFDGDGKPELVAWNQGGRVLLRFKIPARPATVEPWPSETLFTYEGKVLHEGLAQADLDGDGVNDIVGAGRWWHRDGAGGFAVEVIDDERAFSRAATAQLVEGGTPEVIFSPGDVDGEVRWYERTAAGWKRHVLLANVVHGHSLSVGDVDGDGHADILVGEMGQWTARVNDPQPRVFVFFGDGRGNFRRQVVSTGQGVHEAQLVDLDGDGRLDIFAKPFRFNHPLLVAWFNRGKIETPLALDTWRRHHIDGPVAGRRVFVATGDLDGDGRPDLIAGPAWYRQPASLAEPWEKHEFGGGLANAAAVCDFDGDGAPDVLGTDGQPRGTRLLLAKIRGDRTCEVIDTQVRGNGDFLQGVAAGRWATRDVWTALSWHDRSKPLEVVMAPAAGKTPWTIKTLSTFSLGEAVSVGDIDGDADTDFLLGTSWLRNDGETWSVQPIGVVNDLEPKAEPDRNKLADLNGDGLLDAVVSLELGRKVYWFEQKRGADRAITWTRHEIADVPGMGFSLDVADFDGDGDMDVVVGEHRNPDKANRVLIFENADGKGGQWRMHVVDTGAGGKIDHHDGTLAIDLDGDGDLDLVSTGWTNPDLWVFENLARSPQKR